MKGVDESLGKVIETLEKIGELENTVIIYKVVCFLPLVFHQPHFFS